MEKCIIENGIKYELKGEQYYPIDVLTPPSLLILFVFYKHRDIHMDSNKTHIDKIWNEIRETTCCDDDALLIVV